VRDGVHSCRSRSGLDVIARQDITQSDEISYLGCNASKILSRLEERELESGESKTQMWCRR
jgi:hypothetical protein